MLLPNVLASQRAREANAIEAILVRDGIAWEGTKANLFAVSGGVLRTAPKGPRILPGVTRAAALEAAAGLGIPIEERPLAVEELVSSEEVFLASTTLWTYPLVEIEGRRVGNGKPGPVATRIFEVLQAEFRGAGVRTATEFE
jgi:D-alanine transaminase